MSWNTGGGTGKFKWRPRLGIYTDGQNNKFDPETFQAHSYGWWCYVKKIKGKVVFNAYPYSPSTQGHQSTMRTLLTKLGVKIDATVYVREGLKDFANDSLEPLYTELFKIEIEGKRARKAGVYVDCLRTYFDTRVCAIEALKANIRTCRMLGAKFSRAEIEATKRSVLADDADKLERARRDAKEKRDARKVLAPKINDLSAITLLERDVDNFERVSGF
jgi:hypothetical protein